jgi:hypothetical protein
MIHGCHLGAGTVVEPRGDGAFDLEDLPTPLPVAP